MVLPYRYRADVLRVVDADTIDMRVDLGMHTFVEERFRVFGIDAWETRGVERPQGLLAKTFAVDWFGSSFDDSTDWPFIIDTHRDSTGKYGRWLATIFKLDHAMDLATALVLNGHAEWRTY